MLAPIGTPPLNMRKIGFDVRRVIEEPAVKDKLASIGAYVMPMSADALAGFIASQQRDWKPVAEAAAKDARNSQSASTFGITSASNSLSERIASSSDMVPRNM